MHFNVVCLWGVRSVSKPVLRYFMSSSGSESILGKNVDTLYSKPYGVNELFLPIKRFCNIRLDGIMYSLSNEPCSVKCGNTDVNGARRES